LFNKATVRAFAHGVPPLKQQKACSRQRHRDDFPTF
jgi:hypothetical protein